MALCEKKAKCWVRCRSRRGVRTRRRATSSAKNSAAKNSDLFLRGDVVHTDNSDAAGTAYQSVTPLGAHKSQVRHCLQRCLELSGCVGMADTPILSSYSQQFASRQPAAARKAAAADNFNGKKANKRPTQWRAKDAVLSCGQKASLHPQKTLVDAFKQHGMRLCDGARLNAVGKGIYVLGKVPPTVCASVTSLYLSQNNLRALDGIEQFAAVRLLSVGGNLISSDVEVARLSGLTQLRNLNLMGNPLCDQPNYRLRVIAMIKTLQVLDNSDVTKKERDAAPEVAAQDEALRTMVTQNHFDIQKLQRIALLIALHKEFYGCVLAGVASGKFDRVPSPNDVACNVPLLLRLWKYENTLSEQEQEAFKVQMLTIIIRTHAKLADHPRIKAKEYLLKLAGGSSPRAQRQDGASNNIKQWCTSWEEAYTNVIALQQKTIANLHALCDKNRGDMVEFLKDLLSMDPRQRNKLVGGQRMQQHSDGLEVKSARLQNRAHERSLAESRVSGRQQFYDSVDARSSQHQLPPQQQDPDAWGKQEKCFYPETLHSSQMPRAVQDDDLSPRERGKTQMTERHSVNTVEAKTATVRDRKTNFRSGDFAKKTLGEAIHNFKLRESTATTSLKPPGTLPLPSKIPRIHNVYTMQERDETPIPRELFEKQHLQVQGRHKSHQQSSHTFQGGHRDTEIRADLSYCQRRVSSAFTREDLDMTSISEISQVSSSPPRAHRASMDSYIPISKSPCNPAGEAQVSRTQVRSLEREQQSQPTDLHADGPQSSSEQLNGVVHPSDGRLQELEQREEKYIRALMQSEQRELDLRNNLSNVQRKLSSYQRTLAQQLHEREAIKEEVAQRTLAVAAPKILKRSFIRWIRFYNWAQQVKHIQRKRCFIVQHDRFWLWRRKVWIQQELRAFVKKQQLRLGRLHYNEWVNVTRVNVIAKRSVMVQESRLLKKMLGGWASSVTLVKREKRIQQQQQYGVMRKLQLICFREWKRMARYKKALERVQERRLYDSQRMSKQVVLWNWKVYLYSVARPIHERSAQLRSRIQNRQLRLYVREWRKVVEISKVQKFRFRRRMWRQWVNYHQRVMSDKHAAHYEKIALVKVFFNSWHTTASEQAISRRALSLAKRYVNRRRLRKLWVHWKYFSMAKRKYTQDSTKALKHYFMKLLRASWAVWTQRTHANLQRAKTKKYGTLQRHFDAFRIGIRLVKAQKANRRMLAHAEKRHQWSLLRQLIRSWQVHTVRNKRCKQNYQLVNYQQKQRVLMTSWRQWRTLHVENLHQQVNLFRKTYDTVVKEKHELEAHLQAAKDTALSLTDQIEIAHERSIGEGKQVLDLEQRLRVCEERNANLESELKGSRLAIERERHAWEDALCEEEEKRESDSVKYRSLAQDNQVLQVQAIELKRELEAEKAKVVDAEKVLKNLRAAADNASTAHNLELAEAFNTQKELQREIAQLRGHLKDQEVEREDTANRLQEYEKRIVSTCEAMNEHEQAHERENERLRNECTNIETKWKEEQAKNVELSRLLQEKNQLILNKTHRVNHAEASAREQFNLRPGHESCGASHSNQDDCGRKDLHASSCVGQQTRRKGKAADNDEDTTVSRPRSLPIGAHAKQLFRHSSHAVSVRPLGSHRLGTFESPMEAAVRAEEVMIDKHTSKVHEDIRLLQERISKRLDQVPAYAQLPPRLLQRTRLLYSSTPESPISSCSSPSDDDSDDSDDKKFVADRVRRARLKRLQTQKQAVISAMSPALAASRVTKITAFKAREKENVVVVANKSQKKTIRKPISKDADG
ncbi:unnamed protein product [Phytophthora lilii]|uniref:Unnamed protein product n=1 Tax=Phytophthora lilii TaxID=2077276 RepID=A0A9W6TEL0_9STRA|nr:unnamed protein product [Phytophthora lilii]